MKKNLNSVLTALVLDKIPTTLKPVSYLMDLLNLSRESAYRRLRGEIPFSFEETAKLSTALNFSIDEILSDSRKERASFDFPSINTTDPSEIFFLMLQKYNFHVEDMNAFAGQSIMALNRLPSSILTHFDHLFKFSYYKWIQQNNQKLSKQYFSEITLSENLLLLQQKIKSNLFGSQKSILIFDSNTFFSLIKEIQYYYQGKLIDKEELAILKMEFLELIDLFEEIAKTGTFENKSSVSLFLYPLNISGNTGYGSFENTARTIFWIFTVNPIIIENPEISTMQKKWLDSIKRQSISITQSNEFQQSDFFDKQREYLKKYLNVK